MSTAMELPTPAGRPGREHLLDVDLGGLGMYFDALGEKSFRAAQVLAWVYRHGAVTFDEMTNLPKALREKLGQRFDVFASRIVQRSQSSDGTVKVLLGWPDGASSECVMIPAGRRRTACISSQVGCPVGCTFCASGLDGLKRSLTAGEMVEQVLRVGAEARAYRLDLHRRDAGATSGAGAAPGAGATPAAGGCLNNVVFMGLGEPLANYEAVMRAVRTLNAAWELNIGARHITISTVGIPSRIRRLADEGLQLNLALSLHAPTDGLRLVLIPWAEKIPLSKLAEACRYYFNTTGREITLEYLLMAGTNDRRTHAEQLARFAKRLRCNVNLIRYNPVEGLSFGRPTSEAAYAFQRALRDLGVNAHVRTSRGLDIDAACGQLRRRGLPDRQWTGPPPTGVGDS